MLNHAVARDGLMCWYGWGWAGRLAVRSEPQRGWRVQSLYWPRPSLHRRRLR